MQKYHYVYRITNIKETKHYYGTRSSNCLPHEDLGFKYFSSSKDRDFIQDQKSNPENYKYKIIRICKTRKEALNLEIELHEKFNVGVNESFYNRAKQTSTGWDTSGMRFSEEEKDRRYRGKPSPMKGKKMTEESKQKMRKPKSKEHIEKIKLNRRFQKVCNNAIMKIYDQNDNLIYTVPLEVSFEKFCEEHNLPFRSLKKSYQRNGEYKFFKTTYMRMEYFKKYEHCEGWYCIKLNKGEL